MLAHAPPRPTEVPPARRPPRMATNVPTDLLRTFVAIVDAGSMAQATETIFLTQSALSLQMKRLEDLLQQRVFQRNGRSLALTPAGEELVSLARQLLSLNDRIVASLGAEVEPEPLQLGLVQDFADTLLPDVLAAFAARHPRMRIQLRVGGTAELLELFERGRLDVAMGLGRHGELRRGTSRVLADAPMAWIGDAAHLSRDPGAELPLVLLEQPCAFRTALLETLERARLPYRIVLETPSLPGLRAALKAGLGITCRTCSFAALERLALLPPDRLPELPRIDTVLLCRDPAAPQLHDLVELLERGLAGAAPDFAGESQA